MSENQSAFRQYIFLIAVIITGIILRFYFQTGHIFSDDAYYSYLSYSFLKNDFASDYLGYPVFPLRIGFIVLTAFSMMIFGTNEFATIIFPFLFSLVNILLTYKFAQLITNNERVSFISTLLITFFPTDIIFATVGFPDLINVFFINLGIYFLLKSFQQNKFHFAVAGGISLFLSMQFKETVYYVLVLLFILQTYLYIKNRRLNLQLITGIIFIIGNYLIEGFVYLLLHNDFFYRLTITNLNYNYSFYDFFPYTAQKFSGSKNYFKNLFDQIFLINAKSIFIRRFYLFLPLVSIIQTYLSYKKKEYQFLLFWFFGTAILMVAFTTSFTEYKPLDLARSWYIYPLLMPVIILSSLFINRFSTSVKSLLLTIYLIGSLIMCFEYRIFFDSKNLESLKLFLRNNSSVNIYTDHFTKYSVDLIRGYKLHNSKRIAGSDFNFGQIAKGDWLLYNKKHIEELQMQKYLFPDFDNLKLQGFRKIASFNEFIFFEKSE
jgi:hypothetical protein